MSDQKVFRIHAAKDAFRAGIETLPRPEPAEGEVLLQVRYSAVNYKDALAGTGRGRILRRSPLVGGIDAAGTIAESRDPRFSPGDAVVVTGCGLSENHDGGYAEYLCVPGDWAIPLPADLAPREAALIGTAGFTAALAIQRMEDNRQAKDNGPILVTGATGGVGSFAIDMLSAAGYEVAALTGKAETESGYLAELGAGDIIDRHAIEFGTSPLGKAAWGGAVDNVGGATLAWLTRSVKPWGSIASIGLAGGAELATTVMPFILRGVSLLGINSADCPLALRRHIWSRIFGDLRPRHPDLIRSDTVTLEGLPRVFERMLDGGTRGRIVVALAEVAG